MSYCVKCGKEIIEGAAFCTACGAPVKKEISQVVAQQNETAMVYVENQVQNEKFDKEEQEFLDNTHNLLRWELTAWSITSKILIIMGIIYTALFMTIFLAGIGLAAEGESLDGGLTIGISFLYAVIFGGTFLGIGIVSKKAAQKIPQYLNTVYTNLSIAYNRCGNVGMLVFSVILGAVSPIFFIINFVRMKSNRAIIEKIIKKQQGLE